MIKLLLFTLVSLMFAAENIAVLDLDADGVTPAEARTLTNKLRGELIATDSFRVIERGEMDNILKEQGFQNSGACNDQACIVEVGQLLGVKSMVAGSIGKVGNIYLVSLRMIDVGKGSILKNVDEEVEGDITGVLRMAIPRAARRLAGAPVGSVVPESASPDSGLKTSLGNRTPHAIQEGVGAPAEAPVQPKPLRLRRLVTLGVGRATLDAPTFTWQKRDSTLNITFDGIHWTPSILLALRVAVGNFYSDTAGSGLFIGCGDLGFTWQRHKSEAGEVKVWDSLTMPIPMPVQLAADYFTYSQFCLHDNILLGYRTPSRSVSFEFYSGLSLFCEFGILSGKGVKEFNLNKLVPRLGLPVGLRLYKGAFVMAFEYISFFKAFRTKIDPYYDTKTGDYYEGDLPLEGTKFWNFQVGVAFGGRR